MKLSSQERDMWLEKPDDALLRQCEQSFYIGSGKGGQHRNKTETGVRLKHLPSGLTVTDCSGREREVNRSHALGKLRSSIALSCRCDEILPLFFPEPSVRHRSWALFAARLLDVLCYFQGAVGESARQCGLSTGRFVRVLEKDPDLWQAVNRLREQNDLPLLKHS